MALFNNVWNPILLQKTGWKNIDDYSKTKDNNFNLLRFLAAFAVVWSHTAIVVGGDYAVEPLMVEMGFTLGHLAVNVFFVISGFLIAQSLLRSSDMIAYFSARFLRLIPGLLVASFVTAFIVGPLFTNQSVIGYFSNLSTWLYVPFTGSLLQDNGTLPGVFADAPFAFELNTPLWTLRWEALAYIGLAVLGALGLMATKPRFTLIFVLFVILYFAITLMTDLRENIAPVDHVMRFGLCFLLGSGAYVFRKKIPVTLILLVPLCLLPIVLRDTAAYQFVLILAIGYTSFWLAYVPTGAIRHFNKLGDFSYGIYIYGFLIKQMIITIKPELDVIWLMVVATPSIILVAGASYYLIELPAMQKRKQFAASVRAMLHRAGVITKDAPAE